MLAACRRFALRYAVGVSRLPALVPEADALFPTAQRLLVVTAGVQLLVAMQAQVHEVGGQFLDQWPLAGGIGHHQGYAVLAQQVDEGILHEALMADLYRMAQWGTGRRPRPWRVGVAVTAQATVMGLADGPGKQLEQLAEQPRVELETGRKLPEKGPQLVLQLQWAGGEEVGHGLGDVAQAPDMGDIARRLDAEDEVLRGLRIPAGKALGGLQGIEGAVDLDAAHRPRGVFQLPALQ